MKKILYIYTDWNASEKRRLAKGFGGVSYYRVMKPAEELRRLGYDVTVAGEDLTQWGHNPEKLWPTVFSKFDAVVVKQIDNPQAAGPLFFFAQQFGKPVIMDLDDDYFNVKPDQPAYEHYKPGTDKRAILGAALSLVDGLIVSTEPLKNSYQKFFQDVFQSDTPIFVAPNCNDERDWPKGKQIVFNKTKGATTIGYAGSITHNADLQMVLPAIHRVMEKYPKVKFEILGALDAESFGKLFRGWSDAMVDRVEVKSGTHSWAGYPELLCSQNWDIGIAPLVDDVFTRGKSHIKWMEYSMAGFVTVASPVYPYIEPIDGVPVLEDGATGFFCRSTDDWVMVLSRLIEDPEGRSTMAARAREAIIEHWQYHSWGDKWAEAIESILCNFQTRRQKSASSRTAKVSVPLATPGSRGKRRS